MTWDPEAPNHIRCPRCRAWVPDWDGYLPAHLNPPHEDGCGYCEHASVTGGVCEFCGERNV